jgi:outer membrane protein assembly factor BamB
VIASPRLAIAAAAAAAIVVTACNSSSSDGAAPPPASSAAPPATGQAAAAGPRDWPRFGFDASGMNHAPRGISPKNAKRLEEKRLKIDGTVDSSPIFLSRIKVRGHRHDLLVMTTTYGRTLGLDAATGAVLWRFVPSSYKRVKGTAQITNATPVADPGHRFVYAASPDGHIHKLSVSTGHEARHWPVGITRDATHEKITSSLNIQGRYVLATTGGYVGDAPPYQGKLVAIDRRSGHIKHVFNSLCSDRRTIIQPSSCRSVESAIWGRAGAVVDPGTHRVYVTSSNGPFNGSTDWGDSILELSAFGGKLLRHYTPANQRQLEQTDQDLGSTSPALLPDPQTGRAAFLLQGGKDNRLRLLSLASSLHDAGTEGSRLGGEVQTLNQPGNSGSMFTAPAVLHRKGLTEAIVATSGGTAAYRLNGGRLERMWSNGTPGTSPVIAGGLVWVYNPGGRLLAYRPGSGSVAASLPAPGNGHWNSPIVAAGRVYLPTGSANDHRTSGELSIYR